MVGPYSTNWETSLGAIGLLSNVFGFQISTLFSFLYFDLSIVILKINLLSGLHLVWKEHNFKIMSNETSIMTASFRFLP
jgi:hypothetical protein